MERKISALPRENLLHISKDMAERGLERESDKVIVGEKPKD